MKNYFFAAGISAILLAAPAYSSTVVVDWSGGTLTPPTDTNGQQVNYSYVENGFNFALTGNSAFPGDLARLGALSTNYPGYWSVITSYDVTRENGGAFGLSSIDLSKGIVNGTHANYTRYSKDISTNEYVPMHWDAVILTSTSTDGSTSTKSFSPWCGPSSAACSATGDLTFDALDFGLSFGSMSSLKITMSYADSGGISSTIGVGSIGGTGPNEAHALLKDSVYCDPKNVVQLDPKSDFASVCSGTPLLYPTTDTSYWSVTHNSNAQGNVGAQIYMSAITFNTPAIVPLPASLPMFALALAGFGFIRRKKARG